MARKSNFVPHIAHITTSRPLKRGGMRGSSANSLMKTATYSEEKTEREAFVESSLPSSLSSFQEVRAARSSAVHEKDEAGSLRVGHLARATGKTVRAIHLYEELGLLEPTARSKGGYRLYSHEALIRIRWITKLQELGLSLGDIQKVVSSCDKNQSAPLVTSRMHEVFEQKLDETKAQIQRLKVLERELEESLLYLEACGHVCEPKRLFSSCSSCQLHAQSNDGLRYEPKKILSASRSVPDLVAGLRARPQGYQELFEGNNLSTFSVGQKKRQRSKQP